MISDTCANCHFCITLHRDAEGHNRNAAYGVCDNFTPTTPPPRPPTEGETIVAWLRELNANDKSHNYYTVIANRIERGEHLGAGLADRARQE